MSPATRSPWTAAWQLVDSPAVQADQLSRTGGTTLLGGTGLLLARPSSTARVAQASRPSYGWDGSPGPSKLNCACCSGEPPELRVERVSWPVRAQLRVLLR